MNTQILIFIIIIFCINIIALVLSIIAFSKRNEHFNKIKYTTATIIKQKTPTFRNVSLYVIGGNTDVTSNTIIQLNFMSDVSKNILQEQNVGKAWGNNKTYNLSWTELIHANLPVPRFFAMATSSHVQSTPYIMLIGGVESISGGDIKNEVLIWAPTGTPAWLPGILYDNAWISVPQLTTAPYNGSLVTYNKPSSKSNTNELVVVIGGKNAAKTISYLYSQPDKWNQKMQWNKLSLQQGRVDASVGISYVPYYQKVSPSPSPSPSPSLNNDHIVVMGGQNISGLGINSIELFPIKDGIIHSSFIYSGIFSDSSTPDKPSNNSLIFLVKGPRHISNSSDETITYIIAIPRSNPITGKLTTMSSQRSYKKYWIYEISLEDVINKKKMWVRSQLSMYRGKMNPTMPPNCCIWPPYYSYTENITKYFYGSADPIGKYISIEDSTFWCDDYYNNKQHNYIFIGGGSVTPNVSFHNAYLNRCGILDIQIDTENKNGSVFTSSYYEGASSLNMPKNRAAASSAIIAS